MSAPSDFSITVNAQAHVATLVVAGDLDAYTAPQLRQAGVGALEGGATRLVIDIADVSFIDSTALGAIVGLLKRAREFGGELVVVNPTPAAYRVIEITGLHDLLLRDATG